MNNDIVNQVAETLDMVSDDVSFVYDTQTQKIICVSPLTMSFDEEEEFEDERYLYLPDRYYIDEFSIMDEFAYSYPNASVSNTLRECLIGRGAFRRFKDTVSRLGIREEWFAYRDKSFFKIAENWCIDNGLVKPKSAAVLLTAFKGTSSEKLLNSFSDEYQKLILENDKDKSVDSLVSEFKSREYDFVISLGQKPVIKDKVYIELSGTVGNKTYSTDFESDKLASALRKQGLSVRVSNNAGTSYCNNIYYHGLKYIVDHIYSGKMVFVHIPAEKNISDFKDFSTAFINAVGSYTES